MSYAVTDRMPASPAAAGKPGVAELVEPEWIDPGGQPALAVAQLTADSASAASRAKPRSGKQS